MSFNIDNVKFYAAGAIAGIGEVLGTHPIDLVKTKIQQYAYEGKKFSISSVRGVRGFYTGALTRMYFVPPMRALYWGVQDISNNALKDKVKDKRTRSILSGWFAGVAQTFIDAPSEYLKTQEIKNSNNYTFLEKAKNVRFSGFTPTLYRNSTFATIFTYMKNSDEFLLSNALVNIGFNKSIADGLNFGLAGVISSVVTQPLDCYKTTVQTCKNVPLYKIRRIMYNEAKSDITVLWKGGLYRCSLGFCTMALGGVLYDGLLTFFYQE